MPRRKRTTVGRTLRLGAACDRPRSPLRCSVGRTAAFVRASELGHNTGACAPSRTTPPNRPLSWIATSIKRRASTSPAHEFDAHSAVGRPERKTSGSAPAGTNGTPSTREGPAPPACTSGLQHSASRASGGPHIPIGMKSETDRRAHMIAIRDRQLLSRSRGGARPMRVRYHDSHGSQHYPVVSRLLQQNP